MNATETPVLPAYGTLRSRLDEAVSAADQEALDAFTREQEIRATAAIADRDPEAISGVLGDLSRLRRRAEGLDGGATVAAAFATACRMLQYAAVTASHAREVRLQPPQTTAERILELVATADTPLSNQEIADALGIDKAYVSRVIARLISAKQLKPARPRRRQYDQRRKYVTATPAARRALDAA